MPIDPIIGGALITGGGALLGNLMQGIGEGKLTDEQLRLKEMQMELDRLQQAQQTKQTGLSQLAGLQSQSNKQFQGKLFKDQVARLVGGGM